MKMKWLKMFFFIIIIGVFTNAGLAQNCTVNDGIFNISSSGCSNVNNLSQAITQYVTNLTNSFQNPNNACIPEKLRKLLEDRLCGASTTKIWIFCQKKKPKKAGWKWGKDNCGRKIKIYLTEQRTGGAAGSDQINLNEDLISQSPDVIEMTLYHEMIHIAENYYGETVLNKKDISTENYSYTCTKNFYNSGNCTTKTYPTYQDCPNNNSNCIPCSQYTLPR
jgi:hypothetical protein